MDMRESVIDTTKEIFATMVMMDVSVADSQPADNGRHKESISGVIGLAGTYKGVMAIHLPYPVAFAITGNFLGMEVDQINEDVEDAIGEVANMLGGNIKSILSQKGRDIDLSLPTTISGADYEFQTNKEAERQLISFSSESGTFIVELQLEK